MALEIFGITASAHCAIAGRFEASTLNSTVFVLPGEAGAANAAQCASIANVANTNVANFRLFHDFVAQRPDNGAVQRHRPALNIAVFSVCAFQTSTLPLFLAYHEEANLSFAPP